MEEDTLKKFGVKLAPFLAPAVLVAVACAHFATVLTSRLSPWKGGGFGMFSTVESPASRVIRVHLLRGGERTPVQVPDMYRRLATQIKTRPNQPDVDRLASALSAQPWAVYTMLPVQEQYYRLHQKYFPGSPLPPDAAAGRKLGHASDLNELFGQMQWLYMLKRGEKADRMFEFDGVEVECLQVRFDSARGKLSLESVVKSQRGRHAGDVK